ncbi:MAG: c-type cytochrome [Nitrospirae bacterium]|nr:c-type cytochrome [Nitrospirota bacterium]
MRQPSAGWLLLSLALAIPACPEWSEAQDFQYNAKIALGLRLFFDPRLSGDNRMSCAGCHIPALAFTDGRSVAIGSNDQKLTRNTPTLLQAADSTSQFWDGRVRTLEDQVLEPVRRPDEMNQDLDQLVVKLGKDPEYARLFEEAFGSPVTLKGISEAVAAFERTILSHNSPFDRYLAGDRAAISPEAQRGMEIFQTKGRCAFCHKGLDFTDREFHNLGVPEPNPKQPDLGRYLVTKNENDRGAFKTPTLRNIAQTAPYMHNGTLKTLEEVAAFYNKGGGKNSHLDKAMTPLGLTRQEQQDLVSFLKTLTGRLPVMTPPEFK